MKCQDARKWMSPYLDSELGQTKTFEVSEHLRVCPPCAARFESERQADELIRARLERDRMPAELWRRISRDLAAPRWMRVLRSRAGLALAASILVSVMGVAIWRTGLRDEARPTLVRTFVAESPSNGPFVGEADDKVRAVKTLRESFGLQFVTNLIAASSEHTSLEIVDAVRRSDASGRSFIELHLNCCGKPVLLALARPARGDLPDPLRDLSHGRDRWTGRNGAMNVAAWKIGDVQAVAVSRHPVQHVVGTLRPAKT